MLQQGRPNKSPEVVWLHGHSERMRAKEEHYARIRQEMWSRTPVGRVVTVGRRLLSGLWGWIVAPFGGRPWKAR